MRNIEFLEAGKMFQNLENVEEATGKNASVENSSQISPWTTWGFFNIDQNQDAS